MIASPLLRLEAASAGYTAEQPVLGGLDLRIDNDDRIALLGQNGNGKSTVAKLIAGKLKPLSGHVFGAQKVDVGYFAQHQLDDLNPDATPFDYMLKLMPEATEAQRRTRLGTFGFGAEKADTACRKLSGGEKARLLLALTAFHAPHFLILDEPTNHLDVDSREALIHALMNYNGAVILNQPRPASNRGDRRPALAGARRNREALRRPYGKLPRAAARRARRADERAQG